MAWAAGSLLSSKAALPSAPSWGPILCLHPLSPSGVHGVVTKAEDPVDVKRCQSSMWAHQGGAGPQQFPSWGPHHSSGKTKSGCRPRAQGGPCHQATRGLVLGGSGPPAPSSQVYTEHWETGLRLPAVPGKAGPSPPTAAHTATSPDWPLPPTGHCLCVFRGCRAGWASDSPGKLA